MCYKKAMKKIVVLTSGGDSPGMNAALRAVVRTGSYYGIEVWAANEGYLGLVREELHLLGPRDVSGLTGKGGTILRSSRCQEFFDPQVRAKVIKFLYEQNVDGLVVIGGDGSFRGAKLLFEEGGPKCIGIPGTIDNDIVGTEYTIGFDTACNNAIAAVDKLRDTAYSNSKYFVIEVMGQRAGFIALSVGIATGAEFIIVPEFPMTTPEIAQKINNFHQKKQSLIMIVAEAGNPGRSVEMVKQLSTLTPFEYRNCILGHIQRGGNPTMIDRDIASKMGFDAVKALLDGQTNKMVAQEKGRLVLVDFPKIEQGYRKIENQDLIGFTNILSDMSRI